MEAAAALPRPTAGLQGIPMPAFPTKLFDMVEDPLTNEVISWSSTCNSFIVLDCNRFSTTLLPRYFKHNNFSSFIRQLYAYGFRKVDPGRFEFAHEQFQGGQRQLLKNIKYRRNVGLSAHQDHNATGICMECGLEVEVDRLRRDHNKLKMEILMLRQQLENSQAHLTVIEERIQSNERGHQQMMTVLARALKDPSFNQQLHAQAKLLNGSCKKRRFTEISSTKNELLYEEVEPELVQEMELFFSMMANDVGSSSNYPRNGANKNGSKADIDLIWEELLNEVPVGRVAGESCSSSEDVKDLVEELGI